MSSLTTFHADIKSILTFPDQTILYTVCRELRWSHLRLIMRVDLSQAELIAEIEREKRLIEGMQ